MSQAYKVHLWLRRYKRLVFFGGTFVLVIFSAGFLTGAYVQTPLPADPESLKELKNTTSTGDALESAIYNPATVDFGEFWKAWFILEQQYSPGSSTAAQALPAQKVQGAIAGLAASYQDQYTTFLPKEASTKFKEQVDASFEGIGAVLAEIQQRVTVEGTLANSPAALAGLLTGDGIVAVDGVPTFGKELQDVVGGIRGKAGTTVHLTVAREGKEILIDVVRGKIIIPTLASRVVSRVKDVVAKSAETVKDSVKKTIDAVQPDEVVPPEKMPEETQYFVLQLVSFSRTSTDAFLTDLKKFNTSGSKNLIIDLRNNPGGYLDVAVDLASYFLPKGELVVAEQVGRERLERKHLSLGYELLASSTDRRMVIIINKNSASASEIIAGALQDYGVAKIVGEKSFGKGSVQTLIDLPSLGSLKVTVARWYTPKGRSISDVGIMPDSTFDPQNVRYASSSDPFIDAAIDTLNDDTLWNKNP